MPSSGSRLWREGDRLLSDAGRSYVASTGAQRSPEGVPTIVEAPGTHHSPD
jgi:hypothetical protein